MPNLPNRYQDCINQIGQLAVEEGSSFSPKQAEDLIKRVEQRLKERQGAIVDEKIQGTQSEIQDIVKEEYNKDLLGAVKAKQQRLLQEKAWLKNQSMFENWDGEARKIPITGNEVQSSNYRFLKTRIEGTLGNEPGVRNGTWQQQRALSNSKIGQMVADMERAGVGDIFKRDQLGPEVLKETSEWSKVMNNQPANPGISGSEEANTLGKIIANHLGEARQRFVDFGMDMGNVVDFNGSQAYAHDRIKIRQAGFEAWRDKLLPALGKIEKGPLANVAPEELNKMLKESWLGLATGDHARETLYPTGDSGTGSGGSIATRVGSPRIFHFNDIDKYYEYLQAFGKDNGSIRNSTLNYLDNMAKQEVLLKEWGTKPKENFDRLFDMALQDEKTRGPEAYRTLLGQKPYLDKMFNEIAGGYKAPGSEMLHTVGRGLRQIVGGAHMGMMTVTATSDAFFHADERQFWGMNRGAAFADFMGRFLQNRALDEGGSFSLVKNMLGIELDKAPREYALQLGAGLEGMNQNSRAIFSEASQDLKEGSLAWIPKLVAKLSGIHQWDNANNGGLVQSLGSWLASRASEADASPLAQRVLSSKQMNVPELQALQKTLPREESATLQRAMQLKRLFNAHDISPEEWGLLKQTLQSSEDPMVKAFGMTSHPFTTVSPYRIQELPEEAITQFMSQRGDAASRITPQTIANTRNELELKFLTMFQDRENFGLPRGGPGQYAFFRGAGPGTFSGEGGALVSQFKTFGLAQGSRIFGRDLYMNGGVNNPVFSLAQSAIYMMLGWQMQAEIKNFLSGKKPDSLTDPKTWETAALGTGAGFLIGDYFINPKSLSDDFTSSLSGSGIGIINDAARLGKVPIQFLNSKLDPEHHKFSMDGVGRSALRLTKDVLPFSNLPYTKALADYLVHYNLSEFLEPGSLQKMENRMQKNGQEFYLPPSQNIAKPMADKERELLGLSNNQ